MECGICYSYKLDTELPSEVCNDSRCGQAFHHSCLFEVRMVEILVDISFSVSV